MIDLTQVKAAVSRSIADDAQAGRETTHTTYLINAHYFLALLARLEAAEAVVAWARVHPINPSHGQVVCLQASVIAYDEVAR